MKKKPTRKPTRLALVATITVLPWLLAAVVGWQLWVTRDVLNEVKGLVQANGKAQIEAEARAQRAVGAVATNLHDQLEEHERRQEARARAILEAQNQPMPTSSSPASRRPSSTPTSKPKSKASKTPEPSPSNKPTCLPVPLICVPPPASHAAPVGAAAGLLVVTSAGVFTVGWRRL